MTVLAVILVALVAFVVGVAVGALIVGRLTPRIVARLSPAQRLAFARKVNQKTRAQSS